MAEFSNGPAALSHDSIMSGYLNKKTKDGRWQKRWFETNGVYLTCTCYAKLATCWCFTSLLFSCLV